MADAYVSPEKRAALAARMAALDIDDDDLIERFILGSGSGGQKVNKTHSCVQLQHKASGIDLKCQRSRSRELNRYYARQELCSRLEEERLGRASRRRQEAEKIRRQKRRRSRRQKQRMLENKHHQSEKKARRGPVGRDE
jgi:protein subunit release factor B